MAMEEAKLQEKTSLGTIKIADQVIGILAGIAASEVEGVAGMSGGFVGGIAELLGRKDLTKGVKVEVGEKEAAVDLSIVVNFDVKIRDVSKKVQEKVKNIIEERTGLKVIEVNVYVQGVVFPEEQKQETRRVQ